MKNAGIGVFPINIYGSSTIHPWRFDVFDHGNSSNFANLYNWRNNFYASERVNFAKKDGLTGTQHDPNPGNNNPIPLQKKNTRCFLARRDLRAMDASGSLMVQVDHYKVRHWVTLHNDSLGSIDPRYIRVKGVRVEQVNDHYANWVTYASYSDFKAPKTSSNSYQHSGDTLSLHLNTEAKVVKVEVEVNGELPGPIYTKNFDNLKIYLAVSIIDLSNVKI
jgi:hypothetical protein